MSYCKLLERVSYISKAPRLGRDLVGDPVTIVDTFPFNPQSKTAPNTAKRWAESYRRAGQLQTQAAVHERANDPFAVKVIDLEARSEGGRAYKVLDDANRLFDLREDQIVEVMRRCGISPGGGIPGTFVWGTLGSQMRLVLVGGELHKRMEDELALNKLIKKNIVSGTAPTPDTLVPGSVYRKNDKSLHIFIGKAVLPGQEKSLYAFVEAPLEEVDEYYKPPTNWSEMPLVERTRWWHVERYEGRSKYPINIAFMSSPKFIEEVPSAGTLDAVAFREDRTVKHQYVNGHGENLIQKWYEASRDPNDKGMNPFLDYYTAHRNSYYSGFGNNRDQLMNDYNSKAEIAKAGIVTKFFAEMKWS